MANTLDKKIEQIQSDVVVCLTRLLAAVEMDNRKPTTRGEAKNAVEQLGKKTENLLAETLQGKSGLYYQWIAERLIKVNESLSTIVTGRVLVTRKQGTSTYAIFEAHIEAALNNIDGGYGILANVNKLFEENSSTRPTTESLHLLHELSSKTKVIRRRLRLLLHPALEWLYSYRLAGFILLCGLIAVPIAYSYRATKSTGQATSQAVRTQLTKDKAAIKKELNAPEKSVAERTLGATEHIAKAVTVVPNLLIGSAFLLSVFDYVFVKQRWRHSGVDGIRKDLLQAAESVKKLLGKE